MFLLNVPIGHKKSVRVHTCYSSRYLRPSHCLSLLNEQRRSLTLYVYNKPIHQQLSMKYKHQQP